MDETPPSLATLRARLDETLKKRADSLRRLTDLEVRCRQELERLEGLQRATCQIEADIARLASEAR